MNNAPRRALLVAALAGLLVKEWLSVRELAMRHAWLDTWSGLGAIVVGMLRHGDDVSLTRRLVPRPFWLYPSPGDCLGS